MRTALTAGSLALCLAAAGCGGDGSSPEAAPSSAGSTPSQSAAPVALPGTVTDKGTKDLAGDDELQLELGDRFFAPTYVKATPGSTVKVELRNGGAMPHTFTVDAPKIDVQVAAGRDGTANVTIPASGTLAFYCKFHMAGGMQGAFYGTAGSSVTPGASASSGSSGSSGGDGYGE